MALKVLELGINDDETQDGCEFGPVHSGKASLDEGNRELIAQTTVYPKGAHINT